MPVAGEMGSSWPKVAIALKALSYTQKSVSLVFAAPRSIVMLPSWIVPETRMGVIVVAGERRGVRRRRRRRAGDAVVNLFLRAEAVPLVHARRADREGGLDTAVGRADHAAALERPRIVVPNEVGEVAEVRVI